MFARIKKSGHFFSSRRRHTRFKCDWSSDVCSSDLDETRAGLLVDPDAQANERLSANLPYLFPVSRSEERRVGKECRSRGSPYHYKKVSLRYSTVLFSISYAIHIFIRRNA